MATLDKRPTAPPGEGWPGSAKERSCVLGRISLLKGRLHLDCRKGATGEMLVGDKVAVGPYGTQ